MGDEWVRGTKAEEGAKIGNVLIPGPCTPPKAPHASGHLNSFP